MGYGVKIQDTHEYHDCSNLACTAVVRNCASLPFTICYSRYTSSGAVVTVRNNLFIRRGYRRDADIPVRPIRLLEG